tara:strand:- start:772 stop:996 length:225 start_codon:yes stop_codon:yes gene_type:complete
MEQNSPSFTKMSVLQMLTDLEKNRNYNVPTLPNQPPQNAATDLAPSPLPSNPDSIEPGVDPSDKFQQLLNARSK